MNFTPEKLKTARDSGYTDDEIWNFLGKDDQRFNLAKENGYTLEDTITTFSKVSPPEPERREGGGVVGGAADIGIQFMKGLGTGTRMISDVFGANNPVSKSIAGYEDYFDSLLSAESKQDSQEISRILKEAEGKGILPQIMAGLEAFTVAPAEMTASTMGMMLPNLAGGVYAKAAQLTKAGVIGLQMGIGAAQGAGSIKGQIYTAVQEELRQQGFPEDKIDDIATEAQAYNGKNLDQILIGAGLGAAASSTGAEKIMTRLITGAGKEASEDIIKAVIKGGFSEAPIEALQGGQEKIAENVALQRIGVDVPTMQGVIPAATMEATAGLLIGGGFGGVEALTSPEQKEEKKIDKQSNQVANELLAENTPATQSVVKELARRENAVANLQEAYDALEPTSQEAQKLKLELSEAQRNLSAFKGVANKAGLSETITEAERQQIELAKAITAPEVAAPVTEAITPAAEVAPTAPVAEVTPAPTEPTIKESLPVAQESPAEVRKMAVERQKITPRTPEETDAFNKASSNKVMARNPELAVAAVRLNNGEITAGKYADLIDALDPFTTKGAESIPEKSKIDQYIDEGKKDKVNAPIESGKEVEFRIDIPTYNRSTAAGDTVYAVTAHEPVPETSKRVGTPISYVGVAKVINPKMMTRSISGKGEAIDIATGSGKFPLATVKGNYEAITELPSDINDPNAWTEVSYNPIRSSYFVDVRSKNAVVGGSEAIMVGSRVFVKNPQMEARPKGLLGEDKRYMAGGIENQEVVTPIPEANRYTFKEAVKAVDAHFGKKGIPEGVVIVNNTTDPDLEMKAGYFVNRGQIVINLAYIAKGENLGDIIDHELGHYIFGDPEFQADFKQFWDLMTPEEKAKADQIINQFYNKETGAIQMEEKQIRAFMQLIQDSKAMPKWKQLLDKIKRWINEKLGTNLQVSDRGALAVLAAAHKRFKSGEQIIREIDSGVLKMAAEPTGKPEQIVGEEVGPPKKTPEGIIAKTQELLRKKFDPAKVTEQNTTEAFRALGRLIGRGGTDFAKELNDIGRVVDKSGAASEISMGAALFINDLFEYSIRLAAEGNKKMLGIMLTNINKLPTAGIGASDAARDLRARLELAQRFRTMGDAEQDAFINYTAEFIYGPNPTKDQIQSIKTGYDAVEKVQEPTAEEVEEEIAAVGKKTGTDLVGRINDEFTKATEKGKEKRKTEIEELGSEYKKIQEQADKEIEKLAKIQSDTPSFDPTAARQTANDVRAIVANDLKQRPDMGRKAPWKSMLVAKLQEAGVEVAAAETLADIVWRQHEINNLSRELSSINKAIEKGPISEIVKAIKETPLEEQQKPNWRYEVMRDYLRRAGLSLAQAERIAKLMDISLQKRFTQAKEQAFTDAISKTAPWKAGDVRSKRAFQQVIQAIRSGALDPSRNMASDIAALNGWTGFSADQYKNLLKNDAILADPKSGELQKAEAYKAIQDIISKSKLPIRARDVIGQYYDAQALSGIPTLTVNSFSPIAFAMRNAIVEASSGTIKGDAKAIGRAATAFVDSIKSWANTVAFSFKNNVTVYSNVDYIVNDDNLLRLYRKGVDQFTKSKNAKERADGVKNMMVGMMDYVRRILNALDYGAIASLQNQNISKYAMAVMKRQKMNDKQANEMFGVMMKAKNDFYLQQIAIGTDKNKAGILADEFYISSWKEALSKAGVEKSDIQQAMDAAINDALSSVGRNRQSLDAFKEEDTKLKDAGVSSMPALWLLESVANAANRSDNQIIKLFSRVIYGFAIVPARVIRETAWFSPYGFVRFGYDAIAKKMGKTSPYAQSLGTDIQYSQRLNEAVAGTVALVALLALRAGSTDDPEDEDAFKIVFTGNGPQRKDDAQFYDSWYKAGNKPNSMILSFGKTKFTLNMMRGFEAFTWPAMMLGALDDLEIRKKQKQQTKTPAQLEDAAIVAGFVFDAALRRGPYAFTTKSLFGQYGDIGVEGVAKGLTFPAKTLIPVLGTSLASNLSNFLNDPIDRRTLDGAVWSNIPFIGPAVAPKSLNAFGEPSLSTDFASKMFKLGVPIVYDIPTDRESIKLHELVLKQGGGPSIPTRNQLAQRLDRQPTNKEYEMFVREYGTILTTSMKKNYDKLFNAKPEFYSKAVERIGNRARDVAENKVRQAAKKP
jgi:hypothetical protein